MRNYSVQGNLFKQESRLCEFLFILPVPEHIRNEVNILKEEFGELYGDYNSRYSIPHITICDFLIFEHRTYDVLSFFRERLGSTVSSLHIGIDGFRTFESSKTLYLNVNYSDSYDHFLHEVNQTRRMLYLKTNYFQSNTPHITIAKNLRYEIFKESSRVFLKRSFKAEFDTDQIQVLKHDFIKRRYQLFGTIPLGVQTAVSQA